MKVQNHNNLMMPNNYKKNQKSKNKEYKVWIPLEELQLRLWFL